MDPLKFLRSFLDLLFPKRCFGCREPGAFLCELCLERLPRNRDFLVRESWWALDGIFVIAPYAKQSLLQECIKAMKYHHAPDLAIRLGTWMGAHLELDELRADGLIPIPLHPRRERARGYNQARLLAQGLAEVCGLSVCEPLVRVRATPPQAQLDREHRLRNLAGAFSVRLPSAVLNKKFILVDDVCSTGATLNECAQVLKAAGAAEVWGCVLARS